MKSIITIVLTLSVSFVTVSQANELTRLYERAFNFLGIEFGQNSNEVALLTEWQEGLEEVMVAVGESRRDHVAGQVAMAQLLGLNAEVGSILQSVGLRSGDELPVPQNLEEIDISMDVSNRLLEIIADNLTANMIVPAASRQGFAQVQQRHEAAIMRLGPYVDMVNEAAVEIQGLINRANNNQVKEGLTQISNIGQQVVEIVNKEVNQLTESYQELYRIATRSEIQIPSFDELVARMN